MADDSQPGYLDLYHRTTPEAAERIMRTRTMLSKENTAEVYCSTHPDRQTQGYGLSVVQLRVPQELAQLEDEFPDGEQHYRVPVTALRPEHFITTWTQAPTATHDEPDIAARLASGTSSSITRGGGDDDPDTARGSMNRPRRTSRPGTRVPWLSSRHHPRSTSTWVRRSTGRPPSGAASPPRASPQPRSPSSRRSRPGSNRAPRNGCTPWPIASTRHAPPAPPPLLPHPRRRGRGEAAGGRRADLERHQPRARPTGTRPATVERDGQQVNTVSPRCR